MDKVHHQNYDPVKKWICLNCNVKLQVIEFCLTCPRCGMIVIKNLYHGWEGPQLKQTYNFGIHYNQHITCILAREKEPKGLERVLAQMPKEGVGYPHIQDVRRELKKIKGSNYNKHAPLILKRITGIGPPDISDELLAYCRRIFFDFMKLQLFLSSGKNSMPYQYIIYKIFDAILNDDENRRILNYIHLPTDKTLQRLEQELDVFIC
jgi:hypothetical protein